MSNLPDDLLKDIQRVQKISILPMMLEVICQSTGMGFAAVARVNDTHRLACSVRDEIGFGLKAGGELELETTLCHDVKNQGAAIIIDHVAEDKAYCDHHTPRIYGLQSYISYPIVLKNGDFFGTLCAIDSRPAQLKEPKIANMFALFAELLSFHLQSIELMERSTKHLTTVSRDLGYMQEENLQYRHISSHTLREPLRKIQFFSERLVSTAPREVPATYIDIAVKIRRFAKDLDKKIQKVSEISELAVTDDDFETVDLTKLIRGAAESLEAETQIPLRLTINAMPTLRGVAKLLLLLFHHLLFNAIRFAKEGTEATVNITGTALDNNEFEIKCADQGIGIEGYRLENIFNLFEHSNQGKENDGYGTGLSICRRIVHMHNGRISASHNDADGTVFTIVLPV